MATGSEVLLTSNLNEGNTAYDNQIVTFRCTLRSKEIILAWSSSDYIGPTGTVLEFSSVDRHGRNETSQLHQTTVATLINATTDPDTGVTEIVSELRITTSAQYPNSSVSCQVDNHGTPITTVFCKA